MVRVLRETNDCRNVLEVKPKDIIISKRDNHRIKIVKILGDNVTALDLETGYVFHMRDDYINPDNFCFANED